MSRRFYRFSLCTIATFALAASVYGQSTKPENRDTATAATPAAKTAGAETAADTRSSGYYHYMLAHEYEEMATTYGRPEYANRAIEEYKLALDADPSSKYLNSHLAELYFRTGRIKDAILAAQDQIKKDPSDLDAHKLLANIYLRSLGDGQQEPSAQMLQLAIGEYLKITQLEPNNAEDRLLLGRLYAAAHDSAKAEEQFQAARKIDPDSEETVLTIAQLSLDQGDTKHAISVLNSLPDDDQTSRTEFLLGQSYDQEKDTKNAITAYRKALGLEPDNLDVERKLADALLSDNQYDQALAAYKDIAEGDPGDARALLHLSDIYRHQGKFEQALGAIRKAKTIAPDSLEIDYDEGLLKDAVGDFDGAAQDLEKLAESSDHPSGQYSSSEKNNRYLFLDRLANVYREQGKTDLAVATYQKMTALGDDYAERAWQSEVDALRDAHEYDKAADVARTAAEKLPKDSSIQLMLAMQLADTDHADEGLALAKAQLKNTSDNRDVDLALAQMYTRLRRWKDGEESLDAAEKLSTKQDDKLTVYFLRGALLERQKRYDEAEVQFRKVLAIDPGNTMTLNYLGYMLADHGTRLNEALGMIQKAVQLDPLNYAYLDSLGWAYYKMGQYTQAENNLRRASERDSMDPTVHDHLGEVYEKTGRLKLAAAQWELSLNEYAHTVSADMDPGDVGRVQKKLDSARVRLAKEAGSTTVATRPN
ncbi:tetratricopeptide repeat protein [Paracidobacterium acidisoli]|uniref:Tetratricopeptide repeat protein n=1 Tax=Paracidobacterium acidisoli TaxID=2303751 RepID=A0A372IKR2_9BACT|nr:tetratricopeptide repeat protein [Paracidobacterium acidisoli]MBT9332898.1 tetratricopeptide repeat protein [Paracidobacterium acidisoli]